MEGYTPVLPAMFLDAQKQWHFLQWKVSVSLFPGCACSCCDHQNKKNRDFVHSVVSDITFH